MRRILYLLLLFTGYNLPAQPFKLVKDINTSKFFYNTTTSMGTLFELNDYLFLYASYPPYGDELWKIDKRNGNKQLVKDIYPGSIGGSVAPLIVHNNTIFFKADDGLTGRELWKSDGTTEGTVLVKDINPGSGSSYPNSAIIYNNSLVFVANGELWRTDGTEQGTFLVKDIYPGVGMSNPRDYCIKDGILYFSAADPVHGRELWRTDGTSEGTYVVMDIYPGFGDGYPFELRLLNGYLIFGADDGTHGAELWKSDGTAAGTILLKEMRPGTGGSAFLGTSAVINDKLYYSATTGGPGPELWVTDGTSPGTRRIKSFGFGGIREIVNYKDTIFLQFHLYNVEHQLWKSDGTDQGTILFKVLQINDPIFGLTTDQNYLYYVDRNYENGAELWVTDGTIQGCRMVKDIEPGYFSSELANKQTLNGQIYFWARTSLYGPSIWKTDGTSQGTVKVVNFLEGTNDSYPNDLIAFRNNVYFTANDSIHGKELWRSDGTEAGTFLLKEVYPGKIDGNPRNFVVSDTTLYFLAAEKLWKTNGTSEGTVVVHPTAHVYDRKMVSLNGQVYFVGWNNQFGPCIWKSNGTQAGTVQAEIGSQLFSAVPEMTAYKGTIFFSAITDSTGHELWKIDTVSSRAVIVKDIFPGWMHGVPARFITTGNYLYFTASNSNGLELWRTDGTEPGTIVLEILPRGIGGDPEYLTAVGDELYFTAVDSVHGRELWKTNGTIAGTMMVKDINIGSQSTRFAHLINLNGILYFDAYDPEHGYELWKTDGTQAGTVIVKETWAGTRGNSNGLSIPPFSPCVVNETLILTRSDGINGEEPWLSNGTEAGTMMIQDVFPGTGTSFPNHYTASGDKIYFTANIPGFGYELWAGKIEDIYPKFQVSIEGRLVNNDAILDWHTTNERLLDKFEIQRSTDEVNFITIKEQTPKGGLGIHADYSFRDSNVVLLNQTVIKYRLRISDTARAYSYSDTVSVMIPNPVTSNSIKVWPIPSPGDLNISIALIQSDDINFALYDLQGRAVKKWSGHFEKGISSKIIHLQVLNAGVYYLSVEGRSLQQLIKLIKM